jgi:glycosyltransferase involved in cell wall biosynthesis
MSETARLRVAENAAAFERLVAVVERRVAAGRWDSAAAWARIAAMFTWTNPHDALREVRLDRALDAVARARLAPVSAPPRAPGAPRRVLHVLTEGHHVGGGHVPMALRWVDSDEHSRHDVAFTRPGCESPVLTARIAERGGAALVLAQRSLVERARALRAAAGAADVVVCHTYPDDPVPAIAFGGDYDGAAVVMVNLADHVFWLGVGNVALVMNLRRIGAESTVSARGYPAGNMAVVPTPLPGVARALDRDAAKRRLGIDPRQVVLVTLARGVKYARAPWHAGFVDVVAPALRELEGATLLAVGPDPAEPQWTALRDELPGRVLVPGPQPDPAPYLDAADVYLDSFPFGSVTSMLEAATRDVPVLASRAYPGLSPLMSSMGPLDDVVVGAPDTATYHAELRRLVADPALRASLGAAAGAAVRSRHGAGAWREHLAAVYAAAGRARPVSAREAPRRSADLADYAELLLGIEKRAPLLFTIMASRDGFDAADRAASRVRTTAVRAVQRLSGGGPGAGAAMGGVLIPQRGIG